MSRLAVAAALLAVALCSCDKGGAEPDLGADAAAELDVGGDAAQEPAIACERAAFDWGQGGGDMLPGADCLQCHVEGGSATTAFTIAGTVFRSIDCPDPAPGAVVHVEDAAGKTLALEANTYGNFYRRGARGAVHRLGGARGRDSGDEGARRQRRLRPVPRCGGARRVGLDPGPVAQRTRSA